MEECEYCGCIHCECNSRVDGYECKECGYTPTHRELQRGSCPQCLKNRREARNASSQTNNHDH